METNLAMKQAMLDRIRVLNKQVTNKILIHIAGKRSGHFAILRHVGRKSGKLYRIPIIAEPFQNGFVIALTYGKKWIGMQTLPRVEAVRSGGKIMISPWFILNSSLMRAA